MIEIPASMGNNMSGKHTLTITGSYNNNSQKDLLGK
jgi:hypothetical protein